jgi:hypothetical protein
MINEKEIPTKKDSKNRILIACYEYQANYPKKTFNWNSLGNFIYPSFIDWKKDLRLGFKKKLNNLVKKGFLRIEDNENYSLNLGEDLLKSILHNIHPNIYSHLTDLYNKNYDNIKKKFSELPVINNLSNITNEYLFLTICVLYSEQETAPIYRSTLREKIQTKLSQTFEEAEVKDPTWKRIDKKIFQLLQGKKNLVQMGIINCSFNIENLILPSDKNTIIKNLLTRINENLPEYYEKISSWFYLIDRFNRFHTDRIVGNKFKIHAQDNFSEIQQIWKKSKIPLDSTMHGPLVDPKFAQSRDSYNNELEDQKENIEDDSSHKKFT